MENTIKKIYLSQLARGKTKDGGWLHGLVEIMPNYSVLKDDVYIKVKGNKKRIVPESFGRYTGWIDNTTINDFIGSYVDEIHQVISYFNDYRGVPTNEYIGTPIYEGDILAVFDIGENKNEEYLIKDVDADPSYSFVVKINDKTRAVELVGYDEDTKQAVALGCNTDISFWVNHRNYKCVVIGNIWDRHCRTTEEY